MEHIEKFLAHIVDHPSIHEYVILSPSSVVRYFPTGGSGDPLMQIQGLALVKNGRRVKALLLDFEPGPGPVDDSGVPVGPLPSPLSREERLELATEAFRILSQAA